MGGSVSLRGRARASRIGCSRMAWREADQHATGQEAKAEPLYQRSLALFEAKLGKDHPHVAYTLASLAELYREQGRDAQAEPLYQRGLAIREAKLGQDHPEVAARTLAP